MREQYNQATLEGGRIKLRQINFTESTSADEGSREEFHLNWVPTLIRYDY